ncbi:MAG: hypothetical protein D6798_10910 [Deltaproteobacteria bacterium]|nr:MAG: hypothetical protein D6798_10910 [Deltaproteobacteria bacterium]
MDRLPLLVQMRHSPWSLKARLALGLAGIRYRTRTHVPLLGEPALRLRTRRLRGRVTVPVLVTSDRLLTDSFEIARWALAGTPLWPDDGAIARWDAWSEDLLCLGRVHATRSMLADPAALVACLPPVANRLGSGARLLGAACARRLLARYPVAATDPRSAMAEPLARLAEALAGQSHLLHQRLTYADVTAAVGLSYIEAPGALPLPSEVRPHYQVPPLAERHRHLLDWRDRILFRCAEVAASR